MRTRGLIAAAAIAVMVGVGNPAPTHASNPQAPPAGESEVVPGAQRHAEFDTLNVYGPDLAGLTAGIAYWNDLAPNPVLRYAGPGPAGGDPRPVIVKVEPSTCDCDGVAAGIAGAEVLISIDPAFIADVSLFEHELGHALGFDDYNTGEGFGIDDPAYQGIMSYTAQDHPRVEDDRALLAR